jgi:hypothetical protein
MAALGSADGTVDPEDDLRDVDSGRVVDGARAGMGRPRDDHARPARLLKHNRT